MDERWTKGEERWTKRGRKVDERRNVDLTLSQYLFFVLSCSACFTVKDLGFGVQVFVRV